MTVYTSLFTNPQFVQATQHVAVPVPGELSAGLRPRQATARRDRRGHLRLCLAPDRGQPARYDRSQEDADPAGDVEALQVYATYYLALAHLDRNNPRLAEPMFTATPRSWLPEPGASQPYFNMFRWGAETNLGRLYEAQGDTRRAIAYYTRPNPTAQRHGNLLRARDLAWNDPMGPLPDPLPPPLRRLRSLLDLRLWTFPALQTRTPPPRCPCHCVRRRLPNPESERSAREAFSVGLAT